MSSGSRKPDKEWSASEIALFKRYWGDPTKTRKQVAELLHRSLDSVVGKAHRLELPAVRGRAQRRAIE